MKKRIIHELKKYTYSRIHLIIEASFVFSLIGLVIFLLLTQQKLNANYEYQSYLYNKITTTSNTKEVVTKVDKNQDAEYSDQVNNLIQDNLNASELMGISKCEGKNREPSNAYKVYKLSATEFFIQNMCGMSGRGPDYNFYYLIKKTETNETDIKQIRIQYPEEVKQFNNININDYIWSIDGSKLFDNNNIYLSTIVRYSGYSRGSRIYVFDKEKFELRLIYSETYKDVLIDEPPIIEYKSSEFNANALWENVSNDIKPIY